MVFQHIAGSSLGCSNIASFRRTAGARVTAPALSRIDHKR